MKKYWLIATFKANEAKRIETNLSNQNYKYYSPKITTKKINFISKEEALFPGYIFVNTYLENFSELKYTRGIKKIIKFGENISYISDYEINSMKKIEEITKKNPISEKIKIGQDATILKGSFKGIMVKIYSLPSNKRIDILLSFLGSTRRINFAEDNLIF